MEPVASDLPTEPSFIQSDALQSKQDQSIAEIGRALLTGQASTETIIQKGRLHIGEYEGKDQSRNLTIIGAPDEIVKAAFEKGLSTAKDSNEFLKPQVSMALPQETASAVFGLVIVKDQATFNLETHAHSRVAKPSVYMNLPPKIGQFTGRVKLLDLLKKACDFESWKPLQPRHWLHLYGLAGLGKSETAIAFANQHLDKVSLIWHISCENDLIYDEAYRALAQVLKIPIDKDSPEQVVRKVHRFLENWQEDKPWLLILDNAEKPLPLPARGGVVITTSQSEKLGSENPILFSIEPFDLSETEQFLLSNGLQPEQLDQLQELHEELAGWPLLVSQVPSYLSDRRFKVSDYLKSLKSIDPLFNKEEFAKYPRSLGQAFALSRAKIEQSYPEAARLLYCCAYLDPHLIEESLFKSWYQDTSPLIWSKKAIDPLKSRSILRAIAQRHIFTLHRLWQIYLQRYLKNEGQTKVPFEEALSSIEKVLNEFDKEKPTTWEQGKLGSLHLMKLRSFELWKTIDVKTRARLLDKAGIWWQKCKGIPVLAEEHFRESFEIRKAEFGDQHPDVATSLNNMANCYYAQGNYEEASKFHSQVLEIRKAAFGDRHPDVAMSLNNMGNCYHAQGNYSEALKLHSQALEIRKAVFGDRHPDVATSLHDMANCYYAQGNYTDALKLYPQALEIRKAVFGEKHPDVAVSLNNMAGCYYELGNYVEAIKLCSQALEIRKAVFGEKHPDVAMSLNNMAIRYSEEGNYTEALKLYSQVLEIYKAIFGERHPDVAASLHNMAGCYYEQGNYVEALKLCSQALEIRKVVLGDRHPLLATTLNNIGECYYEQGNYPEALKLYTQALEIKKVVLGDRHPSVAASLNGMAGCYNGQGNYPEALKLFTQALEIRKAIFGDQHLDVALTLHNMADCYYVQENYLEALKLHSQAYEIRKGRLGDQHPFTLKSAEAVEKCSKKQETV